MLTARTHSAVTVTTSIIGVLIGAAAALAGPLVLLPLAVIAAAAAVIWLPGVVLAAYILIPFYKAFAQPFVPVDLTVVLAATNVVSLGVGALRGERMRVDVPALALWSLLAILVAVGTLYAADTDQARFTLLSWIALVALPLLAVIRVASHGPALRQMLWTLFGFGTVVVVLGTLSVNTTERLTVLGSGTLGVARASLLVPIIGLSFVVHRAVGPARWAALALTPLAVIVTIASGSRGPLIALIVVGAVYIAVRFRRRPMGTLLGAAVILSATVLALLAFQLPEIAVGRITVLVNSLGQADPEAYLDASTTTRIQLLRLAMGAFSMSPLAGLGTDAFEASIGLFVYPYPHNLIAEFAADFGLIGVALVVVILITAMRRVRRSPEPRAVGSLLVFFVTSSAVLSGSLYTDRTFWAFVLLALVAVREGDRAIELSVIRPSAPPADR